jgi:hypothetical protein
MMPGLGRAGAAALPRSAASRTRTIIYWAVTLPVLAETAAGIQWDLAGNDYVKEVFDKIGFPYYFLTILDISKALASWALRPPPRRDPAPLVDAWARLVARR